MRQVVLDESYLRIPVYVLSGGEQQRISLARAFLRNCDTVLADEPTGNLDLENSQRVIAILRKMAQEKKTVIIASHDPMVLKECEQIISL